MSVSSSRIVWVYIDDVFQEDGKTKEKDKGLVTLNIEAILKEIQRMGEGLISDITLQE